MLTIEKHPKVVIPANYDIEGLTSDQFYIVIYGLQCYVVEHQKRCNLTPHEQTQVTMAQTLINYLQNFDANDRIKNGG